MKKEFYLDSGIIYLNSGTHSLTPISVLNSIQKNLIEYEKNPTKNLSFIWEKIWLSQVELGLFLNANPLDLFLRNNVTEVLNEFILGHKLKPGDEILTSDQEYGAILNIIKFKCKNEKLKLKTFSLPTLSETRGLTANQLDRTIENSITSKTKMIVISEIYSHNGLTMPVEKIAKTASSKNIILVVDGAHGPGYLFHNFSKFRNIDYYAGNIHKWMMGPKGTAFGWVNPARKKDLKPIQIGWVHYDQPIQFKNFGKGNEFSIRQQLLGCQDYSRFLALHQLFKFWNKNGKENIFNEIRNKGELLISLAQDSFDFKLYNSKNADLNGPLFSFELPSRFSTVNSFNLTQDILHKTKVQVAIVKINDKNFLRLSPHIYTTDQKIKKALLYLRNYFKN